MTKKIKNTHKRVKLFVFIYVFGISLLIISHFNFGINYGFHFLQDSIIKKMGYKINIEKLATNINSYLNANKITFSNSDSTFIIEIDSVNLEYNGIAKLFTRKHVDYLKLKSPTITINRTGNEKSNEILLPKINFEKIVVENAQINIINGKEDTIGIRDFSGSLAFFSNKKSATIIIDELSFFQNNINRRVNSLSVKVLIKNNIIKFKDLLYKDNYFKVESDGKIKINYPNQFKASLVVEKLRPNLLINNKDSLFFEQDVVSIFANLSGNREKISVSMKMAGIIRNEIIENFEAEIKYADKTVDIYSLSFVNSDIKIGVVGSYNLNNDYKFKVKLDKSYPRFFGIQTDSINISGEVDLNGNIKTNNYIDYDISCNNVFNGHIPQIYGKLNYNENGLKLLDTNKIIFEDGIGEIHGEITKNNILNLFTNIHLKSLVGVPLIKNYDMSAQNIIHRNHISGNIESPNIVGRLYAENIKFKDYIFGSVNFIVNLEDIVNKRSGEIYLNTSNIAKGKLKIKTVESLIELSKDTVDFNFIELHGDKGYMELTGKLENYSDFNISNIYVEHSGNEMTLQKPINVKYKKGALKITPFELSVNDGVVYGNLNLENNKDIQSNIVFSDISIGKILQQSKINLPISGILNGAVNIENNLNAPKITTIVQVEKAKIGKYNFDNIIGNISYFDSTILVNNFKIKSEENKALSAFGELPFYLNIMEKRYELPEKELIDLDVIFNEIDMNKYSKFLLKKPSIGGDITGILSVNGCYKNPKINFPHKINNLKIENINFESEDGNIQYSNKKLSFVDMKLTSKNGKYSGYGWLPMDFSIIDNNGIINKKDSIFITMSGNDKNLTYLTPFIKNLEQVNGDIFTTITVDGTWSDPIRNGRVNINNADMTIAEMKNNIKNVNGTFDIKNNIMDVNCDASLFKPISSILGILGIEKQNEITDENIKISGKMDMAKFFRPKFDLNITGKNVNILTLSEEIDIIGDLSLNMYGKDTINVNGKFQTNEGILKIPFGNKIKKIRKKPNPKGVKFTYEISVPIDQDVYLKNNYVDVELNGEVILKRDLDGNQTIGGEVDIVDGFFYFQNSIIFDVEYGNIIFDEIDGNHSLNFRATKEIDNENKIVAMLTGDVVSPEIQIYDENNLYTQSELVEILTIGSVGDGSLSNSLTKLSGNILTNYAESTIEHQVNNLDIIQNIDLRTGSSLTNLDSTSIKIGSRLGRNVYFTIESGQFNEELLKSLELEYRINRNLSIVGKTDEKSASGAIRLRFQY